MSMHVNFSGEMEAYIKGKVASGFYGNATEVIRDAVRRMQEEEARAAAWKAAIELGEEDVRAGRTFAYTPELMDEIFNEALNSIDQDNTALR